jgi:hypothetical protein
MLYFKLKLRKMKKFISLLFISALSASIALIAYNELFITESNENSGSIAKTNTFPVIILMN